MAIERVREYFKQWGLENRIMEFDVSSATVELAAQALSCRPERIAKTLSFRLGEQCILIVAAGDAKIDNAKYKAAFGAKAKMLSADEAEACIGHAVGGVCPFAVNGGVKVYLDQSLKRFGTVFPACGSSNSAIELTPQELEQYASSFSGWVDVCKNLAGKRLASPFPADPPRVCFFVPAAFSPKRRHFHSAGGAPNGRTLACSCRRRREFSFPPLLFR